MKRLLVAAMLIAVAGILPTTAQTENESFDTFRKSVLGNFQTFRKQVLDDYATFLDGIWREYDAFTGRERHTVPKPQTAPMVPDKITEPQPEAVPEENTTPKADPKLDTLGNDVPDTTSGGQQEVELDDGHPETPVANGRTLQFYSMTTVVPQIKWEEMPNASEAKDFAKLWRAFATAKVEQQVLPQLLQMAREHRLNDWFLYELIRAYCDAEPQMEQPGQRMALAHYMLANAGFDVRIALTTLGEPLLLVPFEQEVYARSYTTLGEKKYYLFFDNMSERDGTAPIRFYTCDMPLDVDCGRTLDLLIRDGLAIPYYPYTYRFCFGGLQIQGELNANIMPMLYRYPQMAIGDYAQSVVSDEIQKEVTRQFAKQLGGLPQQEAVDKLLQFVQSAFEYATDHEQHGFEKPYFFEEMLYYPQCDCEDRSVFYSYLLRSVLGVENHLIEYPGHESVSVNLGTTIDGYGYVYEGCNFYISDPTFIGAKTGMCMPDYIDVVPQIDYKR